MTTTTPEERAALRQWYGAELAPKMEALFASASSEAYDEAATLNGPGCEQYGASKAAARRAAYAILRRAREAGALAAAVEIARAAERGGAR